MPTRRIPFEKDGYYHVYNRGMNGSRIFYSARNYQFFIRRIKEILVPNHALVICYALMPTHYHLLVQIKGNNFSSAFARLAISYTKSINIENDRSGPLFEGRFKAIHIDSDECLKPISLYPFESGQSKAC